MRGHNGLTAWAVAGACMLALLLVGCDSAKPAGPESPDAPKEPVQRLRLEALSDTMPAGAVGTSVASSPVVRLTLDGNPAPGREVQFLVTGGGSIDAASQRTDTAGLASPGTWTLDTIIRSQTLTARVAGAADLVFTAVVKAGPPATLDLVAGNHQSAAPGAALPIPLQVKAADRYGNPAAGVYVGYQVIVGTGTVADARVMTDSLGLASPEVWTLGAAGPQAVRSSVPGKSIYFEAFACENPCHGRDLLFVAGGNQLYSQVNGVASLLFTAGSGSVLVAPTWSPDGRQIAFAVEDYDYDGNLVDAATYIMDADGSNAAVRAYGFSHPSWSPDGRRLAVAGFDGVYTLSVAQDGTAPNRVAENAWDPAWSPDGTKIAFVQYNDADALRVMNADGSGVTTVVPGGEGTVGHPTWSPDGARLAFTKCLSICKVFTVSASGTDLLQLTAVDSWDAAWSPDGLRIAIVTSEGIGWLPATVGFSEPILMSLVGYSPAWRP